LVQEKPEIHPIIVRKFRALGWKALEESQLTKRRTKGKSKRRRNSLMKYFVTPIEEDKRKNKKLKKSVKEFLR